MTSFNTIQPPMIHMQDQTARQEPIKNVEVIKESQAVLQVRQDNNVSLNDRDNLVKLNHKQAERSVSEPQHTKVSSKMPTEAMNLYKLQEFTGSD